MNRLALFVIVCSLHQVILLPSGSSGAEQRYLSNCYQTRHYAPATSYSALPFDYFSYIPPVVCAIPSAQTVRVTNPMIIGGYRSHSSCGIPPPYRTVYVDYHYTCPGDPTEHITGGEGGHKTAACADGANTAELDCTGHHFVACNLIEDPLEFHRFHNTNVKTKCVIVKIKTCHPGGKWIWNVGCGATHCDALDEAKTRVRRSASQFGCIQRLGCPVIKCLCK